MSCSFQIRGPGRPGRSGAKTVTSALIRPSRVASRRWSADASATSSAVRTSLRSRTDRECQYRRPMHRLALRQATRAPKASSSVVWRYVPVSAISARAAVIRRAGSPRRRSVWWRVRNSAAAPRSSYGVDSSRGIGAAGPSVTGIRCPPRPGTDSSAFREPISYGSVVGAAPCAPRPAGTRSSQPPGSSARGVGHRALPSSPNRSVRPVPRGKSRMVPPPSGSARGPLPHGPRAPCV